MELHGRLEIDDTGDVGDIQGGTTKEGIHLGAMAGTVDLVQRGQTGLQIRHDMLHLLKDLHAEGIAIVLTTHEASNVTAWSPARRMATAAATRSSRPCRPLRSWETIC